MFSAVLLKIHVEALKDLTVCMPDLHAEFMFPKYVAVGVQEPRELELIVGAWPAWDSVRER